MANFGRSLLVATVDFVEVCSSAMVQIFIFVETDFELSFGSGPTEKSLVEMQCSER